MVRFSQTRWERRQTRGEQSQTRFRFFQTGREKPQSRSEQPERLGPLSDEVAASADGLGITSFAVPIFQALVRPDAGGSRAIEASSTRAV